MNKAIAGGSLVLLSILYSFNVSAVELLQIGAEKIHADLADDWQLVRRVSTASHASIELEAPRANIQITFIRMQNDVIANKSDDEFKQLVRISTMPLALAAIDRSPTLAKWQLEGGRGYVTSFSDRQWQHKEPPEGEWSKATAAIGVIDSVLINATLFSNDWENRNFLEGLKLLQSLVLE